MGWLPWCAQKFQLESNDAMFARLLLIPAERMVNGNSICNGPDTGQSSVKANCLQHRLE